MYTVLVRFETPFTRAHRNPESVGWQQVVGKNAFPTLKGAITRRRALSTIYPRQSTAIRTPGGFLMMITPAMDAMKPLPAPKRIPLPKKRRLVPRNPDYSLTKP